MKIDQLKTNSNITITFFSSENGRVEPLTEHHDHIPSFSTSSSSISSSRSSSVEEDALSIDSNEGSPTLEADVVEIDFVLGSSGDMRLLSRAKKRRLRVNRKNCKHKINKTQQKHKRKAEAQQFMQKKIIQVLIV